MDKLLQLESIGPYEINRFDRYYFYFQKFLHFSELVDPKNKHSEIFLDFITELKSKSTDEENNKENECVTNLVDIEPSDLSLKPEDHKIITQEEVMTGRVINA